MRKLLVVAAIASVVSVAFVVFSDVDYSQAMKRFGESLGLPNHTPQVAPLILGDDGSSPCTERAAMSGLPPDATETIVVRGTVIVAFDGEPISGAMIFADTDDGALETLTTKSDDAGEFELAIDPSKLRALRVEAEGFMGTEFDLPYILSSHYRRDNHIRALMRPGYPVQGTVRALGRPLRSARVRCVHSSTFGYPDRGSSVLTDENGAFEIRCAADRVKIIASHGDFRRQVTDWLSRDDVKSSVGLELEPGVRLCGRALDEEGKPLAGARIHLSGTEFHAVDTWSESRVALPRAVYSGADGMFSFEPLAGPVIVGVTAPDEAQVQHQLSLEGTGERYIELMVESGVQIAGRVELDGKPFEGAIVGWICDGYSYPRPVALSGVDGSFRLKQLRQLLIVEEGCVLMTRPPGDSHVWDYWKRHAKAGFLSTQVRVQPGDENVVLALQTENPGAVNIRLDGRSEGYRGKILLTPLGDIESRTPPREAVVYRDRTSVTVSNLRPGNYRLTGHLSGVFLTPVAVTVVPDESANVTLSTAASSKPKPHSEGS